MAFRVLSSVLALTAATNAFLTNPFVDGSSQRPLSLHDAKPPQQPLGGHKSAPYKPGAYSVKKQNQTVCNTYGENQWTGTVDVTEERRLFFWAFDSRSDPANDPVILWMNGGPGGSSMIGLFAESGPCTLEINATETTPNEWAWNNNATVIYLDQPAGVGFSSLADGAPQPAFDIDGADDFQLFLNVLFRDIFPEKAHLPFHLAGESYGGHYVPTYVNHILNARLYDSKAAFWGNISSLILINAVLDFTATGVGSYELFCSDFRGRDILTDEQCEGMRLAIPELIRLGQYCELSEDSRECIAMWTYFVDEIHEPYYGALVNSGERNMYNIHYGCPNPPVCQDFQHGNFTWYLNQEHIKAALDIPAEQTYIGLNVTYEIPSLKNGESFRTTTRELRNVLDAPKGTGLEDIRVLVLQGNEDYIVNTPGQIWRYDNLRWGGQAEYRIAKWKDLPKEGLGGATGFWKGTKDGKLLFVGIDGAGHTAPGEAGEETYRVLEGWINKGLK